MKIGIIFDLDGTLWNSAIPVTESWNTIIEKNNLNIQLTPQDLMNQMGKLIEDVADNLFPQLESTDRYRLIKECCEYENEYLAVNGGELYEGVEDVFKELSAKYHLYIVSNCQQGYIETFLKFYNFEQYITDIEDAGHTGLPKADNIRLVAERNHLDRAFYVGDTIGDMNSSDEAGAEFIHASYGFGVLPEERNYIKNIRELPLLINKLLEKESV